MLSETEEELVKAAQAGNTVAFSRLIRAFEAQMLAVANGFTSDPADADDIYQDAMIAAFKALPRFKLESKFGTWLYRIVVNTALSHRRKLKRVWQRLAPNRSEEDGDILDEQACAQYETPEAEVLNRELNGRINQALESLTDKERMAFVLCHQQGFKIREAAEMLSSSDNLIKVSLFRARKKLRAELDQYQR